MLSESERIRRGYLVKTTTQGIMATPEIIRAILARTRRILMDPAHWTQFASARRRNTHECLAADPEACCWCLTGAIILALGQMGIPPYSTEHNAITDHLVKRLGGVQLSDWNDKHDTEHTDVLNLLHDAIHDLDHPPVTVPIEVLRDQLGPDPALYG